MDSRFEVLKNILSHINSSLSLSDIIDMTLDCAIRIMNAERGFIMMADISGRLVLRAQKNISQQLFDGDELSISRTIVNNVYTSHIPVMTHNAMADNRFKDNPSVEYFGLRSLIAVPLILKEKVIGVIYIDNRFKNGIFNDLDLEFMKIYAVELAIAMEHARLEDERNYLHEILRQCVSPDVAKKILTDGLTIDCRGERINATVLFADIRGFTSLAETTPPHTLLSLLNDFFDSMTKIVFKMSGVLLKFLGDGFMAAFGLPEEDEQSEAKAVVCALMMLDRLTELNGQWKLNYGISLQIGIGVHSGETTAGIIGSMDRKEYTVIGDIPNTASRLEGLTKEYKTPLIVSFDTLEKTSLQGHFKEIGKIAIRGKKEKIRICKLK